MRGELVMIHGDWSVLEARARDGRHRVEAAQGIGGPVSV